MVSVTTKVCLLSIVLFSLSHEKDAQLNEILAASNLEPTSVAVVTRKLEVKVVITGHHSFNVGIFLQQLWF